MKSDLLEVLYQKYYGSAYAYALSLCKNREVAEDIVADAFVKAIFSCTNDIDDFQYWLLIVCRNLWIDQLRRDKRLQNLLQTNYPDDSHLDYSPEFQADQNERNRFIFQCILSFEPHYREVLALHYYADMPIAKIAEMIHLSIANVKTLLCRGRAKIKKKLEENGYENQKN